eukprot:382215_1
MKALQAGFLRNKSVQSLLLFKLPLLCVPRQSFSLNDRMTKQQSNEQVLSEPYPSFLSSLDPKSSTMKQRRYILDSIASCKHSNNVITIIRKTYQDTPDLLNPAIFTVSVQKCNELKQYTPCIFLMDLMFDYKIRRDVIQYNMVLLSLSKCEG